MSKSVVRPTLLALAIPIFIENALHVLTSTIDTYMVSTISDGAVAALGVAHQFVVLGVMIFGFVGIGSSVVVTHSLGGKDRRGAQETVATAISVNLWLGILISLFISLNVERLLGLMTLPPELYQYAVPYLSIVGATLWLEAHNVAVGAILRAHGHATDAMWVTLVQNGLNAFGNWVLLFGMFGAPQMGIVGVALATAGSRVAAAIILWILMRRRTGVHLPIRAFIRVPAKRLKRILSIGAPSAGEHLCWWLAFMTITSFTARLGATELAIQNYTMSVMHFVFTFSFAFALANEILLGHHVGAGEFDAAYRRLLKTLKVGIVVVAVAVLPGAIWGGWFISWFTDDAAIITMGAFLLKLALLIEPGRLFNMTMVCGLRATGDVRFPLKLGIIAMWGLWVPLSWLLGLTLGYGLPGIWAAMIIDETFRGFLMFRRWRRRDWLPHAQRSRDGVTASLAESGH
ncbi:MATE family efflux transporter [Actomonas aquatica]|uniref:MATE family efflux transporter n=1 Tax=Actomonas aquatica TaxID=2866162 RepID=A0ABZ1C9E8_9BACT|nr:MATE family efflux transporter [Opitutus sp. WL0086]WRQ88318.1 MATE family efflux transporter [Opitutus sp. WL0086]